MVIRRRLRKGRPAARALSTAGGPHHGLIQRTRSRRLEGSQLSGREARFCGAAVSAARAGETPAPNTSPGHQPMPKASTSIMRSRHGQSKNSLLSSAKPGWRFRGGWPVPSGYAGNVAWADGGPRVRSALFYSGPRQGRFLQQYCKAGAAAVPFHKRTRWVFHWSSVVSFEFSWLGHDRMAECRRRPFISKPAFGEVSPRGSHVIESKSCNGSCACWMVSAVCLSSLSRLWQKLRQRLQRTSGPSLNN